MDMYGHTATDLFRIDDLLDFSNDDLFSSSAAAADYSGHNPPPTDTSFSSNAASAVHRDCPYPVSSGDFTADDLYVPIDDVAELEWLSQFVDDSFTDFTTSEFAGAVNFRPDPSFHCRSRSKRTRGAAGNGAAWISPPTEKNLTATASGRFKSNGGRKKEGSPAPSGDRSPAERMMTSGPRRCSHCSSEKTPQWRTGPMGPKTLCNACGVRYKSGRLVPEYRPAASPTFVLTQHSNSHRKVLELRRQKEILRQEQQQQVEQLYHHHHQHPHHRHHHDFEVC